MLPIVRSYATLQWLSSWSSSPGHLLASRLLWYDSFLLAEFQRWFIGTRQGQVTLIFCLICQQCWYNLPSWYNPPGAPFLTNPPGTTSLAGTTLLVQPSLQPSWYNPPDMLSIVPQLLLKNASSAGTTLLLGGQNVTCL